MGAAMRQFARQTLWASTAQNEILILPQIKMKDGMQLTFDFGQFYEELSSGTIKLTVKARKDKGRTWTEIWTAKDHMGTIDEENTPEDVTGKGNIAIPANFWKTAHSSRSCLRAQLAPVPSLLITWTLDRSTTPAPLHAMRSRSQP